MIGETIKIFKSCRAEWFEHGFYAARRTTQRGSLVINFTARKIAQRGGLSAY
ncbi:MAG: hypothetical protein HQL28_06475 [Candidatus Omnitrophica bacterium]|nr:hypothetical protein [Candidatus Omnitrophota bacterium]